MIELYSLTNADMNSLMIDYVIKQDSPDGEQWLSFVVGFRQRVHELMTMISLSFAPGCEQYREGAKQNLFALEAWVEEQIALASPKTLTERLVFIRNIEGEVKQIAGHVFAGEDAAVYEQAAKATDAVWKHLKLCASRELDKNIDALGDEQAKGIVEMFRNMIKGDYLALIDDKCLTKGHIYPLLCSVTEDRDRIHKTREAFEKNNCCEKMWSCPKDCQHSAERDRLWREELGLDALANQLYKVAKGHPTEHLEVKNGLSFAPGGPQKYYATKFLKNFTMDDCVQYLKPVLGYELNFDVNPRRVLKLLGEKKPWPSERKPSLQQLEMLMIEKIVDLSETLGGVLEDDFKAALAQLSREAELDGEQTRFFTLAQLDRAKAKYDEIIKGE